MLAQDFTDWLIKVNVSDPVYRPRSTRLSYGCKAGSKGTLSEPLPISAFSHILLFLWWLVAIS